jgi:hypothetical protein
LRSIPREPSTLSGLTLQTLLHSEHDRVDVEGPCFPALALRRCGLGSAEKTFEFFLVQAKLAHALFGRQVRFAVVQPPAEKMIERLNGTLRNTGDRTAVSLFVVVYSSNTAI